MTKQPLFMLAQDPGKWGLDHVGDLYDLTDAPGPGIRALLTGGRGPDAALIDALPDLELIAVAAVGYDKVDVEHARRRGVRVTNTPDVLTDDVADLAIALTIAAMRGIAWQDHYVREGRWAGQGPPPLTRTASGRRIGIVGLGRIGHAIAARAAPFAGEIAYYSRKAKPDAPWRFEPDLVALARWAEVLIVSVAGGDGTAGLVDAEVIAALGPDGVLVNIARGSVVDEGALVAALTAGRLGGAGLDVFADEPNVPAELFALPNVVLLPHQGSATVETRAAMGQLVLDNLAAFFDGRPLLTPLW